MRRTRIEVKGIVQGVGFRPFVYNIAKKYSLSGFVLNEANAVHIEVEGEENAIENFISSLRLFAPPLAIIESLEFHDLPLTNQKDFIIRESSAIKERFTLISPDISTCDGCLLELFDPVNRRFKYPFINCSNCGPRFTIIKDIPYDRANTTMNIFRMCDLCETDYRDPEDRRFHAQPNACLSCGPQLFLTDASGNRIDTSDPLLEAVNIIDRGEILAVKGIGGFHLACEVNCHSVIRLREKKRRESRPFALMADDISTIKKYCYVEKEEEEALLSARRPIVLLRKKEDCSIPESIAPQQKYIGFMLPYAPLHHLLLRELRRPLLMTSGNISDEPIAYKNGDAINRLRNIADRFLMNDRDIFIRCDDSVTRFFNKKEYPIRLSRGYAPAPIKLNFDFSKTILACGAELKNTFCLTHKNYAFVSHHIGDLENLETLRSFEEGIEHFKRLFNLNPEVVAFDLHPEYLSTKYALALEEIPVKIGIQHHHAHIASCMADNNIDGEVIGIAMDGLGYGTDGNLWGCEFSISSFLNFERICHLEYMPMPGGAKAIKEPWRMGLSYLFKIFQDDFYELDIPFIKRLDPGSTRMIQQMIYKNVNSPLTSSMGRLFDAVASLLGLKERVNYEGEAAVGLEMIADEGCEESYGFEFSRDGSIIDIAPVIKAVVEDIRSFKTASIISAKFHNSVADLITKFAKRIMLERGLKRVALSGGVFQNLFLLERAYRSLEKNGFEAYIHRRVPPNDAGISFGQAAIADARIKAVSY